MASMDRWAPKLMQVRDPRDANKKNGPFWNFPRFLYFGGSPRGNQLDQSGSKGITTVAQSGQSTFTGYNRGKGKAR